MTTPDTPAPLVADPAFAVPADRAGLERAAAALAARGMEARIVSTGKEARAVVDELIPDGALVYDTTSRTLEDIGVAADVRPRPATARPAPTPRPSTREPRWMSSAATSARWTSSSAASTRSARTAMS
jgi:hypothetical protein